MASTFHAPETPRRLLLYCRPGYESDCAAEIMELAAAAGVAGFCRAGPGTGRVIYEQAGDGERFTAWTADLDWRDLVFARQWLVLLDHVSPLPADDRVTPLVSALRGRRTDYADLWLEHPDTNAGKAMARFCKRFRGALTGGLNRAGINVDTPDARWRLHAWFEDSGQALLAETPVARSAPWPGGIPRLRHPGKAPSRSTLKLEEALLVLLTDHQRQHLLKAGATAVDLGAAPGGWTWQLVNRHMRVIAVDNGSMQPALLDSGLVDHRREDGFRFRPSRTVDLLVCDMVEKPLRIARLMARWLERGDCRASVFNLKLPMKRRHAMVRDCLSLLPERSVGGHPLIRRCKQLYHDRDEVTVAVLPAKL